jgi:hypothetical protein
MSLPRCCILLLSVLLSSPAVRAEEERSGSNLRMPKIDPASLIAAGVGAVAAPLVLPAVLGVVGFGAGGVVAGNVCFALLVLFFFPLLDYCSSVGPRVSVS